MADATADTRVFTEGYHFLVRRIHSLLGIVPIGVFLCIHLSLNATILAGPRAFQFAVDRIHTLAGMGILKFVEVAFIFIPIAFHALVGIIIWLSSKPNLVAYRYCGNARYTFQRWTGILALLFIVGHLYHVHWLGAAFAGGAQFDPHNAAATAVAAMSGWWYGPVYAIGILCAVFHLANGIWTALITWGITIGPKSQRLSAGICILIGLLLVTLGMGGLIRFKTMDASSFSAPPAAESHVAYVVDGVDGCA